MLIKYDAPLFFLFFLFEKEDVPLDGEKSFLLENNLYYTPESQIRTNLKLW